ncbi:MAG TPA: hypothetical protein VK020_02320 [Microlunatus sp.]|nr:hypothetical protein [Microlunatus sp.]
MLSTDRYIPDQHDQQRGQDRPLPQPGGAVLQLEQRPAAGDEPLHHPAGQAEQPQLLGRLRVDDQPVGVVGVALRRADLRGLPVLPDPALPEQPVGGGPAADQDRRRPPGEPGQHHRRRDPTDHPEQPGGDEVDVEEHRRSGHPPVELPGHGQVLGQRRVLQVGDAGRLDTSPGQLVVQPGRDPAAEVHAHRLEQRWQHLHRDEQQTGADQRPDQ